LFKDICCLFKNILELYKTNVLFENWANFFRKFINGNNSEENISRLDRSLKVPAEAIFYRKKLMQKTVSL
jgi:hypothetical protein